MAVFVFIFAALCGLVTGFLAMMLTGIGWLGGVAIFFATCYGIALLPFVIDIVLAAHRRQS